MTTLPGQVGNAFFGGFRHLRPAQQEAIPPLLRGEDVLITAGTGSGKTEAAIAPLVARHLFEQPPTAGIRILYLTPTRALANDLLRRLEPRCDQLGVAIGIRHGERNDLKRARTPDILVSTPESLDVMLMRSEPHLADISAVVVDEVHLLYNTQRGTQLSLLLARLERHLGSALQICCLSATIADTDDLWTFFWPGRPFTLVRDEGARGVDAAVRIETKDRRLADLLRPIMEQQRLKVLVFVDAKRVADMLADRLEEAVLPAAVFLHHASLDRQARLEVEQAFHGAQRAVCVATSTLELGIDIGDIDLVVLYGRAPGWESFLQRIGRGNRRRDTTRVLCLVPEDEQVPVRAAVEHLAVLELIRHGRLETEKPAALYGAALQQLISFVASADGSFVSRQAAEEALGGLPHLTPEVIGKLIEVALEQELLVEHPVKRRIGSGPGSHELESQWDIWGNFPRRSHNVDVELRSGRRLGDLPVSNLARLNAGAVMLFANQKLHVERVDLRHIVVRPTNESITVEVRYGRGRRPQDVTTLEHALTLLTSPELDEAAYLQKQTANRVRQAALALRAAGLGKGTLLWTRSGGLYLYLTFAGELINRLLAVWLQQHPPASVDDYQLRVEQPLPFDQLPDLETLAPLLPLAQRSSDDLSVYQQYLPDELRSAEFRAAFLGSRAIRRTLERLRQTRLCEVAPEQLLSWVDDRQFA